MEKTIDISRMSYKEIDDLLIRWTNELTVEQIPRELCPTGNLEDAFMVLNAIRKYQYPVKIEGDAGYDWEYWKVSIYDPIGEKVLSEEEEWVKFNSGDKLDLPLTISKCCLKFFVNEKGKKK